MREKSNFEKIFEIITMTVAIGIVKIMEIIKWVTLFLFVFSCSFFIEPGRYVILFTVIITICIWAMIKINKEDVLQMLLFIVVLISSCVGFLMFSWKCIFSEYQYLFLICMGSWLLERIMSTVGYKYSIGVLKWYMDRHKDKE